MICAGSRLQGETRRDTDCGRSPVSTESAAETALNTNYCHAARSGSGECTWLLCPQLRDNEPAHSLRTCPLLEHK
jgi:hypothetical protein